MQNNIYHIVNSLYFTQKNFKHKNPQQIVTLSARLPYRNNTCINKCAADSVIQVLFRYGSLSTLSLMVPITQLSK